MAGKNLIEGIRKEVESLGLELLEIDSSQFGAGFLLLGVVETIHERKKIKVWAGIYIKEFFNNTVEVRSFLDLLQSGKKLEVV